MIFLIAGYAGGDQVMAEAKKVENANPGAINDAATRLSTAARWMGTSGCASCSAATPSGAAISPRNLIRRAPQRLRILTAAVAEPPEGFDYTGGSGIPGVCPRLLEGRPTQPVG